jgi:hypothetical protein
VATRTVSATLAAPEGLPPNAVAFAPNGQTLAVAGDGYICLLDLATDNVATVPATTGAMWQG